MRKKRDYINILFSGFGIIFIIISVYIILFSAKRSYVYSLSDLPSKATDMTGRTFVRNLIYNKVVVVQYGGEPFDRLLDKWQQYESQIYYLFISDRPPTYHSAYSDHLFILAEQPKKSYKSFLGKYFILDYSGNVADWGYNKGDMDSINVGLSSIFRPFAPKDLIFESRIIDELSPEKDAGRLLVLALFRSFCSSCRNGALLHRLTRIRSLNIPKITITVVLDANVYSEIERDTLISQSGLSFPVILSDARLSERWKSMSDNYGRATLDGVLFLFKEGELLDSADASCRCDEAFFQKIDQVLVNKEPL